jgi:hypothetical protein
MQALFPEVLFGAIGLFVVVGLLSMLTRRNLHDQIGQDGLLSSDGPSGPSELPPPSIADQASIERAERELEIRQMLTARSDRLVRQGHSPLDIDAELAKLEWVDPRTGFGGAEGPGDAALAAEVRQLVRARNERRARQGLDALDVEAEVRRTLAELNP